MFVAGIDVGSLSGKCVIMEGKDALEIRASQVIYTTPDSEETAMKVFGLALKEAGLAMRDLDYIVATGYGRVNVSCANAHITEISCHAKGIHWVFPNVRTILDMGGQDCKVISCGENGVVRNFLMNDKCAAGTGRYLERVAGTLDVALNDVGELSLEGIDSPEEIRSYCTVFAEQDIITLLRQGKNKSNIMAGACDAIVKRIYAMLMQVGVSPEFSVSGGVAKNTGITRRLERVLNMPVRIAPDPQIIGALGAAVFAAERLAKSKN